MNKIAQYLNRYIAGNVFDKVSVRSAYATDRSLLRVVPRLVAVPESAGDVARLIRFSYQLASRGYRLPVTIRGKGHDKTGAALGGGLVISTERLNAIQEIDVRGRLVRVQAGATLGELNAALAINGLTIPISGHDQDTIGGLIGNCATDTFAGRYGGIYNYVERAEVILSDGSVLQTHPISRRALEKHGPAGSLGNKIQYNLNRLLELNRSDVDQLKNSNHNDLAGYSMVRYVEKGSKIDILPLLFASQGTLAVTAEVILRCELLPREPQYMLAAFNNFRPALAFLEFAKQLNPLELNLYDGRILEAAIDRGKKLNIPTQKLEKGFVVLVGFNHCHIKNSHQIKKCLAALPATAYSLVEDAASAETFASLHALISGYLNGDTHGERTPILDDAFVPDASLINFTEGLKSLETNLGGVPLALFGSFATSHYSVRPAVELDTTTGRKFALDFLASYAKLVTDCHGSVTGGSPEGSVKSLVINQSREQRAFFGAIKQLFDPYNILNPWVKTGASSRDTIRHLRTSYGDYIVE